MKKIQSLFQRNYETDRLVRDEIVPGSEWVIAGEGIATRKWDGTCCLVRDGKLYKRCEVKKKGRPPANFEPASDVDPVTGKQQGWLPVGEGHEDKWHRKAWQYHQKYRPCEDGTYELVGSPIQGNPEGFSQLTLLEHGKAILHGVPRTFDGIREWLAAHDVEGIVWHHPDGRMVKIKGKDFGLKRGSVPVLRGQRPPPGRLVQLHWQNVADCNQTEMVAQGGEFSTGEELHEWMSQTIKKHKGNCPEGWQPMICDSNSKYFVWAAEPSDQASGGLGTKKPGVYTMPDGTMLAVD